MIWYLHWLQMRRATMVAALGLAIGVVIFLIAIHRGEPTNAHRVSLPLPTLLAAAYLAGTGLRGRDDRGCTLYSLSLPVSRKKLMSSRLGAGWALVAVMLVLQLGVNSALLALLNKSIPLEAMAQSSLLAVVAAAPAMAVSGLLRFYVSERLAAYAIWALSWRLVPQLGFAPRDLPWRDWVMTPEMIVGYSAIATLMLVTLTLFLGQRKEF